MTHSSLNKKHQNCPICGSSQTVFYGKLRDRNRLIGNRNFDYFVCRKCKSLFIGNVPDDLDEYYSKDYPAFKVAASTKEIQQRELMEQSKLSIVRRHVPKGRLIEVGPGLGYFVQMARLSGFETLCMEKDESSALYIRQTTGTEVIITNSPGETLLSLESNWDAVVAWHVIEHLPNPREFIKGVSAALHPGGFLFISTPNLASFTCKLFGKYWTHLDPPRHLTLIPLRALDELAAQHGLRRIDVIYDDTTGRALNRYGWINSAMNLSENKLARKILGKIGLFLYAFQWPIEQLMKNRGAAYTAVYEKINADFSTDYELK